METPPDDDDDRHPHCCPMPPPGSGGLSSADRAPRLIIPGDSVRNRLSCGSFTSGKDVDARRSDGEDESVARVPTPKPRRRRKQAVSNHQEEDAEDDVCFVCFDGGDLVLCDMRHCPKAYHAACTGRGSEYFLQKGKWYCGWHVCAQCTKKTDIQCYTCPNSFCNYCVGKTNFICLGKGKGLCESCIPLITMIEQNLTVDSDGSEVNFDAGDTYECMFKDYWEGLKKKIPITWAEIEQASKWKYSHCTADNVVKDAVGGDNGQSFVTEQSRCFKRKRLIKKKAEIIEDVSDSEYEADIEEDEEHHNDKIKAKGGSKRTRHFVGWASESVINFLRSIGEDAEKPISVAAAMKLLWSYIETNNLAREHSNLVKCDEKLQSLFQKKFVRKFDMSKLFSVHFASKKRMAAREQNPGDVEVKELDISNDKQQKLFKSKKNLDSVEKLKPDLLNYAAIDVKNISLIYLKRHLLEILSGDPDFEKKVTGAFVRIRIPASADNNDACYRLVQIIGIRKIPDTNNASKARDRVFLKILNLQKRDEITLDVVSSQEFTVEECLRLQQCVKSGFLKAMTVSQLEEKARDLQEIKMKDWYEKELLRLGNLRDRASEKGQRKELRECMEKIQILKSPAEKERQLKAPIQVNVDPHMPSHLVSNNPKTSPTNSKELRSHHGHTFVQNLGEMIHTREPSQSRNFSDSNPRSISKGFQCIKKISQHAEKNAVLANDGVSSVSDYNNVKSLIKIDSGLDKSLGVNTRLDCNSARSSEADENSLVAKADQEKLIKETHKFESKKKISRKKQDSRDWRNFDRQGENTWMKRRLKRGECGNCKGNYGGITVQNTLCEDSSEKKLDDFCRNANLDHSVKNGWKISSSPLGEEGGHANNSKPPDSPKETDACTTSIPTTMEFEKIDEKEKMWYYQDPKKKIHGPFSMEQLRKWERTKVFPLDLRVWRHTESQEDGILLTDALQGIVYSRLPPGFEGNQVDANARNSPDNRDPGGRGKHLASINNNARCDDGSSGCAQRSEYEVSKCQGDGVSKVQREGPLIKKDLSCR